MRPQALIPGIFLALGLYFASGIQISSPVLKKEHIPAQHWTVYWTNRTKELCARPAEYFLTVDEPLFGEMKYRVSAEDFFSHDVGSALTYTLLDSPPPPPETECTRVTLPDML